MDSKERMSVIIRGWEDGRQLEEEGKRDKGDIVGLVMMVHSPLFLLECLLEIPTNRILLTGGRIKQKSCGNDVSTTLLFNLQVKQVLLLPWRCFPHLCPE